MPRAWIHTKSLLPAPSFAFTSSLRYIFFQSKLTTWSAIDLSEQLTVRITRLNSEAEGLPLPSYATEGSAGMDLFAAVGGDLTIQPLQTVLVPTGYSIELPEGFEAEVRPRSGLAIRSQIGILNSPGTIDSDYRGEIKVILTNFGKEPFTVRRGDRIAQLVVHRYVHVVWKEVDQLAETGRGGGGFGHTGVSS